MPMLSENEISLMSKQKERVNWTNEEVSKRFTSGFFLVRCHGFWINDLQILHNVLIMLEGYAAHLTDRLTVTISISFISIVEIQWPIKLWSNIQMARLW